MISIGGLCKAFGERQVIKDLNLEVDAGEVVGLVGPSGIGKSTTLNIVAGLMEPDSGEVKIGGKTVTRFAGPGPNVMVHPADRGLGYVMQDNALFPHLSVMANVTFGLRGLDASAVRKRAMDVMEMLRIADLKGLLPGQLSGGQQKRVALARSLAPEPRILLMDEPLTSLDQELRQHLMGELRAIFDRLDLTVIYVTHDNFEARSLADRIAVFGSGRISGSFFVSH
ncbi:MAG TPA: ABC transporter ATP-binding protein [Conexivisphaerales archaeon]|nr:ABC transporter ATP-binding protein [Conexivisphaerales archaeon]